MMTFSKKNVASIMIPHYLPPLTYPAMQEQQQRPRERLSAAADGLRAHNMLSVQLWSGSMWL
jgi:hypothetical protein